MKRKKRKLDKNGKIGIFDSGIGGVTVLRELIKILPKENYKYYSDSKNNPYGDKTEEEIKQRCCDIVEQLLKENCKVIVIACNTASTRAVNYLRKQYPKIPFFAIEPAYKMVYDYAYDRPTLVMATKGTVESEKFHLLLKKYNNYQTYVLPCVGLAEIIEQGDKEKIKRYLQNVIGEYKNKVQNVVLGCTHYPLVQEEITEILGQVQFFNGAPYLAKHLKHILEQQNILNEKGQGIIEFEDSQILLQKEIRFFEILKGEKK